MIIILNFIPIKYVDFTKKLKSNHALNIKLKSFTLIEMLVSLFLTTMMLTFFPQLIKLTHSYLYESYNSYQTEYAFFQTNITQIISKKHHSLIIKDKHTIIIDNESSKNYIEFKNSKLFYKINGNGNIVLLNNVINAEFQILPSNIIKLNLKIGDKNDYYEKNLFL